MGPSEPNQSGLGDEKKQTLTIQPDRRTVTMTTDEGAGKKRVVTESLGWLTESSIMPKKHRAIAGVGASSIFELKAELYKSQEDSRKSRELAGPDGEYQRAKHKINPKDPFSKKNSGVDSRALK